MIIASFSLFSFVLIFCEVLHALGCARELTRKLVHLSAALLICVLPWVFTVNQALVIAAGFLIAFSLIESYDMLPSVTAVQRRSYGGVAFLGGVILSAILVERGAWVPFQLGVAILGLADTSAAFVGIYFQRKREVTTKSWMGSVAFFIVAECIFFWTISALTPALTITNVLSTLLFSLTLTLVEYASPYGLDNLFLPVLSMLMVSTLI